MPGRAVNQDPQTSAPHGRGPWSWAGVTTCVTGGQPRVPGDPGAADRARTAAVTVVSGMPETKDSGRCSMGPLFPDSHPPAVATARGARARLGQP